MCLWSVQGLEEVLFPVVFLGDGRSVGLSADVLVVGQKFDERGVVVCLEVLERVMLCWLED